MAARGVLIPYIVPSYAHNDQHVKRALEAANDAFEIMKTALDSGSIGKYLEGPSVKPVFRKFN
jgi:glutamate-1-semialdehyde 2,1-aminomutase